MSLLTRGMLFLGLEPSDLEGRRSRSRMRRKERRGRGFETRGASAADHREKPPPDKEERGEKRQLPRELWARIPADRPKDARRGGRRGGVAADRRPRYLLPFELRRPQRWKFSEEDGKKEHPSPGEEGGERGGCPGAARWDGETGGDSSKKRSGTAGDGSSNLCPKRLGKDLWESLPALCLSFPPGTAVRGARRSSGRALGQRGWTSGQKSHFSAGISIQRWKMPRSAVQRQRRLCPWCRRRGLCISLWVPELWLCPGNETGVMGAGSRRDPADIPRWNPTQTHPFGYCTA